MDDYIPLVGCPVCGLARVHGFRGAQLFGTGCKEDKRGSKWEYIYAQYLREQLGVIDSDKVRYFTSL